jgi:hypothetical protein
MAKQLPEDDPRHRIADLREMLTQVIDQAEKHVEEVFDLKVKALFQTTAEVLCGIRKAFENLEQSY